MVAPMADPIYGIHQSQPFDIYGYMKANARRLNLVGRFSYLPNLLTKPEVGIQNGMDFIISDAVEYYDEPLMNGQVRRYAKIRGYLADYSPVKSFSAATESIKLVEEEIVRLGYTDMTIVEKFSDGSELATSLGIPSSRIGLILAAAELLEIKAGVPTYINDNMSIEDCPSDGNIYLRRNGEWTLDTHVLHPDIDGGTAYV